ncbi:MAG: hypothetical protein IAF94_03160 [Pirellulaceae bacterium]|nr:hypothetical protein [Pirellulaceae bacterium]
MQHLQLSVLFVLAWCLLAVVALVATSSRHTDESTNEGSRTLIYTEKDLREIRQEWERFWYLDSPSHLSPQRVRGGVI